LGVAYFASIMVRGRWIAIGALSLPVALIGFSLSKNLVSALIFVALLGVSQIMLLNLSNSLIHSEVDDRLRGRVASIFGLTFFGLMPIGGLIMGYLAEQLSEPFAVAVVAILFAGCAFGALFLKSYVKTVR
jgi:MFS family permease